jgi:hypothetical protein
MNLQARATNILTKPAEEWPIIAGESTDVGALLREYAGPLAAVPAVCGMIGMSIVGVTVPFLGTVRTGLVRGVAGAIVSWVLALVGAYIAAVVIEKLAPTFQSTGSTVQALKLVVYAMTPVWVAGVVLLIPGLRILRLLAALYAVYLFYLGVPVLMHTPSHRVLPYMGVSALVIILVSIVLGVLGAPFVGGMAF